MSQNDYIILRDEDGTPYIAHAGLLDNARNTIRGAANSISTTVQQVANKAKGVGRGVRQNHKYILKVLENGKTRYFYKQEEVKAYYEAKKRGIKNAAEYAQNAVKDKASDVADVAKNAVNKATGATANKAAETAKKNADDASRWAKMTERVHKENVANFKQNPTEANLARAKQSGQAVTRANQNEKNARKEADKAQDMADQHPINKAKSAFNQAKKSADNTVANAKNNYERMKSEFRDKAKDIVGYDEKERLDKATENKKNTKDAARKGEQYVTDALNESNPLHRTQTEAQRINAAVGIRNERWDAEDKARAEYLRARDAYNKTPLAMINRAKETVSSATDSVRDMAKDAIEAVARIPKTVKNAAEDVAFNAEYYSKQLKEGITGEKATKTAASIREEAKDWKRKANQTKDPYSKQFFEQQYQQAEDFAKRFDGLAAKSLNGRVNSAVNSVKGMIENARSSTAKAVNGAWDRIPKNSDGTVNPFDKNFQSTYNDWKTKKDKYDNSLTGQAKATAEKATDSVKDMIDQARKAVKGNSASNFTREQEQTNTGSRQTKRTPERTWENSEKKANIRTWDDVDQEINERGHTKNINPGTSSSGSTQNQKSTYGEYSDNDKDFAEKNYSKKNHVEDTDFYTFKRDDGKWVILEEDMKWVLPEGVTGNDPGVRNALKQFADHASSAKAIGNANYNNDQWVDAVTDAIDKAAERQSKKK